MTEIRNILGGHVDATAPHSGHETPAGATAKASTAETNAKSYTDNHAESKTTHGIGSGYYVAKTSRSDQLPAYADIQGKPSSFPPDKHKNSHASGGSDALSPADIGAETPAGAQAKVDAHGNRTDNPHSVTKSQVGLGSVSNYGVATQSEAETGNANNKYMTPQRTKQAIDALQAVKSVAGKTGVVTLSKSDVGLANVDNVKQASKEEFDVHLAENAQLAKYMTTGNQSIPNATDTILALSRMDPTITNDFSELSGNTIKILKDGIYEIKTAIYWTTNATGYRQIEGIINGVINTRSIVSAVSNANTTQLINFWVRASAGDIISVKVFQNSGNAIDIVDDSRLCYVMLKKVG